MTAKQERDATDLPFTVNQVIAEEIEKLRPQWPKFTASTASDTSDDRSTNLKALYSAIHKSSGAVATGDAETQSLSALCFSGGGIRSATFNLGVLQSLARMGLLGKFDYLSSVSGGGYIASWLRLWMNREGRANVLTALGQPQANEQSDTTKAADGNGSFSTPGPDPTAPEPGAVRNLREYSNYLTPRLGLFSGDSWTAAAIVLRNLILNWLVIVPLIAMVTSLPLLFLLLVKSSGIGTSFGFKLAIGAVLLELLASGNVYWLRRFRPPSGTRQRRYILSCVMPIWLAAACLSWAALELDLPWLAADVVATNADKQLFAGFAALWCIGVPVVGWAIVEILVLLGVDAPSPRTLRSLGWEILGLFLSGVIASLLLTGAVSWWLKDLSERPALFVILATPILLSIYLLARSLFVAIAGIAERPRGTDESAAAADADREWWARLSGWVLLFVAFWIGGTSVSFLGAHLLEQFDTYKTLVTASVGSVGGLSGLIGALIASSEKTSSNGATTGPSGLQKWALMAAAPLFIVSVIVLVTWLMIWLAEKFTGTPGLFDLAQDPHCIPPPLSVNLAGQFLGLVVLVLFFTAATSRIVNVNRFSLHGLYRNRLVRAYLGASNMKREPDPFTGFSVDDNEKLWKLGAEKNEQETKLLPIINATLNLVRGNDKLAWQERKAESFSMTPYYCGNFQEGYRKSDEYGARDGISVGTAVTISGAAANPNMGYNSSPALGFLMAMFNLRLGAWLGNTNRNGRTTYRNTGPKQAWWPLIAEMLGLTSSGGKYINLSDGGHFDNLGLYEVVLRRCRYVLVSDAGQDDKFGFEDLGNAIRKIRIDLGVPIEFTDRIGILPNPRDDVKDPPAGGYYATARIRYSEIDRNTDGTPVPDGLLIYVKPSIAGARQIPYDVYSYSRGNKMFPHEPTSDQWFSESQFESYRALGDHILWQLGVNASGDALRDSSIEAFMRRMTTKIAAVADEAEKTGEINLPKQSDPRD